MSYLEEVKNDIINYIEENEINLEGARFDYLEDDLLMTDSVTGNASGSYTFNRWQAEENVKENLDEVVEILNDFGYEAEFLGNCIIEGDWEKLDVIARCWYVSVALAEIYMDNDIEY